jgi:hypothetical protein
VPPWLHAQWLALLGQSFVGAVKPAGFALNEVGPFSVVAALLGITMTVIYLIGLIERKNRAVLRVAIERRRRTRADSSA